MKHSLIIILLFTTCIVYSQTHKKTICLITGQGSDYRIYKHFKLERFDTVHVNYLIPEKNESLAHYALRLSKQIDTCKRFSVIGVSLGGMIAVEIS